MLRPLAGTNGLPVWPRAEYSVTLLTSGGRSAAMAVCVWGQWLGGEVVGGLEVLLLSSEVRSELGKRKCHSFSHF